MLALRKLGTPLLLAPAILATLGALPVEATAQTPSAATPAPKSAPSPSLKVSGKLECSRPDLTSMDVGDAPKHILSIGKMPCRWTQPFKIGSRKTLSGETKMMRDARGDMASVRGYHVGKMTNGDAYYFRFDGQTHSREGTPEGMQGRWAFTGGTGEMAGLKGEGRYKGIYEDDGVAQIEMEGEYRLP